MSISDLQFHVYNVIPPIAGKIAVMAVAATAGNDDLSARAELTLKPGRFITLIADAAIWFSFSDAAKTIDETAETGDVQAFFLPAGVPVRVRWNEATPILNHKAGSATFVRVIASSKGQTETA